MIPSPWKWDHVGRDALVGAMPGVVSGWAIGVGTRSVLAGAAVVTAFVLLAVLLGPLGRRLTAPPAERGKQR